VLLVWDENAWQDYLWWQAQDRRVLKRINTLLADIQRNGTDGMGKPEALKHDFAGYWSRRITHEHRLVYKTTGKEVRIALCRYHYGQPGQPPSQGRNHPRPTGAATTHRR
jgi:toxin YoeB